MLRFEYSSIIDASVEAVVAFHERPEALSLLVPPNMPVRVVERSGKGIQTGARIVLRHKLSGLRWIAIHTAYEKNRLFVDTQASGPFRYWVHRHVFEPMEPNQCRLTDSVEFSILPWGFLDRALGWIVRRQLQAMFQYRHAVTARQCERKTTAA
jgi:ligand-binding SRPBCC domain-containing protein